MFDLRAHIPFVLAGIVAGVAAFAVLLAVLIPTVRGARRASMNKGFVAIAVSFIIMMAAIVVVSQLFFGELVAFLVGELVGFLGSWIILACALLARM